MRTTKPRNKSSTFQSFWINVKRRWPPDSEAKILYYNPEYDKIGECSGKIFNTWMIQLRDLPGMADQIRNDPNRRYLDGYFATHWMPRWRPE